MRYRKNELQQKGKTMILYVYAVRDRATDQYGTPMFLISSGQAIRSFTDEINRQESTNALYMHPDDFDLYALGSYDTHSGRFNTEAPEQVAIGKNVKIRA